MLELIIGFPKVRTVKIPLDNVRIEKRFGHSDDLPFMQHTTVSELLEFLRKEVRVDTIYDREGFKIVASLYVGRENDIL